VIGVNSDVNSIILSFEADTLSREAGTLNEMKRVVVVFCALLATACASSTTPPPPRPPTGEMWGYLAVTLNAPTLEIVGYAPDRPLCEFVRAMAHTHSGLPIPSQRSIPCEPLTVLTPQDGADSVYWVFSLQNGAEHFALGSKDRSFCTSYREQALQALREGDMLSECEPVVVKRES
jgi:hypothetical protein